MHSESLVPNVYVAGPYATAPRVREVHRLLDLRGLRWSSRWAEVAQGPENLATLTDDHRERVRYDNHAAIAAADVLLVLAAPGMCETLVEIGVAMALGVPVVWVDGDHRLPLSATCPSLCTRVASVEEAIALVRARARKAAA
jgi:hypothetical protein